LMIPVSVPPGPSLPGVEQVLGETLEVTVALLFPFTGSTSELETDAVSLMVDGAAGVVITIETEAAALALIVPRAHVTTPAD
jgi:hypothetical protein